MSSIITSRLNPFPFHSICIRELGNRRNVRNSQNVVEDFKGSKSKEILKKKIKITSLARLITAFSIKVHLSSLIVIYMYLFGYVWTGIGI